MDDEDRGTGWDPIPKILLTTVAHASVSSLCVTNTDPSLTRNRILQAFQEKLCLGGPSWFCYVTTINSEDKRGLMPVLTVHRGHEKAEHKAQ